MTLSHDLHLSALEERILTLVDSREVYGLYVLKALNEVTGQRRQIGFGSLYPALHKLEKRGLLKARWGDEKPSERGGARRRYYRITGEGRSALRQAERIRRTLGQWEPASVMG